MANTAVRPHSRSPDLDTSIWFLGQMLITPLATGQDTSGHFALLEIRSRKSAEAPPHVHPAEDEYFYILAGELEVAIDSQVYEGKPGSFSAVPRGSIHKLRLVGDEVHRLTLFTPAGSEGFFQELGEPAGALSLPLAQAAPLDVERVVTTAAGYGIVFPGRRTAHERRLQR